MKLSQAFIISVLIHVLLTFALLAYKAPSNKTHPIPIDLVVIEKPNPEPRKKSQQIVDQVTQTDTVEKKRIDHSLFLSERTERVRRQTRVERIGPSKNASDSVVRTNGTGHSRTNPSIPHEQNNESVIFPRDPFINSKTAKLSTPSQYQNKLPNNLSVGEITSLNTDQYIFYSFYRRLSERLYYYVSLNLSDAARQMPVQQIMGQGSRPWIVALEVLLTPKGYYHSSVLLQSSGVRGFDEGLDQSFKDISPILNPPKCSVNTHFSF